MERSEFIQGLRDVADLYEQQEGLPLPSYEYNHTSYNCSLDTMVAVAKTPGGWERKGAGGMVLLMRKVGPLTVKYYAARELVCEKVVVGKKFVPEQTIEGTPTRIVSAHVEDEIEWKCGSILGAAIAAPEADAPAVAEGEK